MSKNVLKSLKQHQQSSVVYCTGLSVSPKDINLIWVYFPILFTLTYIYVFNKSKFYVSFNFLNLNLFI